MIKYKYFLIILVVAIAGAFILYLSKSKQAIESAKPNPELVVELSKKMAEIKNYQVEVKSKDKLGSEYMLKAEVESKDRYRGEIIYAAGESKNYEYIVYDSICYIKKQNVFEGKYSIWKRNAFPELEIPNVNDIMSLLQNDSLFQEVTKDQKTLYKFEVRISSNNLQTPLYYGEEAELFFLRDRYPYQVLIKNYGGEESAIVNYSKINQIAEVKPPVDSEIKK